MAGKHTLLLVSVGRGAVTVIGIVVGAGFMPVTVADSTTL